MTSRWPDFIIIGAMKSATSSLYAWLRHSRGASWPSPGSELLLVRPHVGQRAGLVHEPVRRRRSWGPPGRGVGELPFREDSERASARMADLVPRARLIYVVRQPVERLRSHYRRGAAEPRASPTDRGDLGGGEPLRGDESLLRMPPLTCIDSEDQIRVVRFEDLVESGSRAWHDVLRFLELPDVPAPGTAHNVTAEDSQWSPLLRWLKDNGYWSFRRVARMPRPIRRVGHRLLMRTARAASEEPRDPGTVPSELLAPIWADVSQLEGGWERPRPCGREPREAAVGGQG